MVDTANRTASAKLRNDLQAVNRTVNNTTVINNRNIVNPNNPRHWNNWGRNWMSSGVPPYQRSWYRGAWSGFYGPGFYSPFGFGSGYGGYGYNGLGALGLGGRFGYGLNPWILNSLGYQWGYYGGFYNPYFTGGGGYPYNYSRPVYMTYATAENQQPPDSLRDFDDARAAFRRGEYDRALSLLDRVLKENPSDTTAHELRALTLFAMGKYEESAAVLNSLLAVAPGWSWETMRGLYPNVDTYTQQLRKLEDTVKSEPDFAAGRFVLGYHYLVAGHQDAARRQFEKVADLQPKDRVAKQLLAGLKGDDDRTDEPARAKAETQPDVRDGEETDLVGQWMAERKGEQPFELTLSDDGHFTWIAGDGDKATEVKGQYELKDQTLVLDGGKQESLVGHLTSEGADRFRFKLLGSPADDPGLTFERARKAARQNLDRDDRDR